MGNHVLGVWSIVSLKKRSLAAPQAGPLINADGTDNHESDRSGLPKWRDTEQNKPVPQDPNDQRAKNCSKDGALATGKRSAPYNGRSDHVQFESDAGPSSLATWQKGEAENPRNRA